MHQIDGNLRYRLAHQLLVAIVTCTMFSSVAMHAQAVWDTSISRNNHVSYDLDCWRDGNCVASIEEGIGLTTYLIHTSDRGVTWRRVYEDPYGERGRRPLRLKSVKYLSATDVLVTADSGFLLRSTDGGRSWAEEQIGEVMSGRAGDLAVSLNGQTGLLTVKRDFFFETEPPQDLLYGTTDRGDSWYLLPNQPRDTLSARESAITFVSVPVEGQYLVGFTEPFYIDSVENKLKSDVPSVFAYSNDTGATWSYHEFDHDSIQFIRRPSVTFFDANNGVLTGLTRPGYSHGIVARTFDGGRSWEVVEVGTHPSGRISFGINHSRFVSFDTGYGAVAERIARTYDGGRTWQRDSVPFIPVFGFQGARRTWMFNDSVGIAMSGTGALYYLNGATSSVRYMPSRSENYPSYIVRRQEGRASLPIPIEISHRAHTVRIYDLHGRLVHEESAVMSSGSGDRFSFDPGGLSTGAYVVSVVDANEERGHVVVLVR